VPIVPFSKAFSAEDRGVSPSFYLSSVTSESISTTLGVLAKKSIVGPNVSVREEMTPVSEMSSPSPYPAGRVLEVATEA